MENKETPLSELAPKTGLVPDLSDPSPKTHKTLTARGRGTPETEEQRKFAADLEALNERLTEATAAFRADFGDEEEKEAFRARILPILQEAKDLFARPGRRDGGPTFDKWLKKNRPKIKVGKTTANKWLAEAGMPGAPPTFPHLGELRIIGGRVGKIVGLPESDGDGKRQMLVKYDSDEPNQAPDSVDLATQKEHVLNIDTVYVKPNGDWSRFADGKLLTFLTVVQQEAAKLKLKADKPTPAKSTTAKAREKIIASAPAPVIEPITTAEAGGMR